MANNLSLLHDPSVSEKFRDAIRDHYLTAEKGIVDRDF